MKIACPPSRSVITASEVMQFTLWYQEDCHWCELASRSIGFDHRELGVMILTQTLRHDIGTSRELAVVAVRLPCDRKSNS